MNISTVISTPPPTLTVHDRCDGCGSQAYVAVANASGELLFCAHHATKHLPALTEQGWEVTIDQTNRLQP